MDTPSILIAEDDVDTRKVIGRLLAKEGYSTLHAENGLQALRVWRNNLVDLVLLDLVMPVIDGIETCRRMRQVSDVPIIILTAKAGEQDLIDGFEAGADDYIVKPFRTIELLARIRAVLHRTARQRRPVESWFVFDELVLNTDACSVVSRGAPIELTPLEFRLLRYMMQRAGVTLSKEDLLCNVWSSYEAYGDINLVEAAIARLRKKIEANPAQPKYIQTVWGLGYRLGG